VHVARSFVFVITGDDQAAIDAPGERLEVERLVEEGALEECFQGS
jgi:hypothetical protein